jgi:hypothetical protein
MKRVHKFTVQLNGRSYACERHVEGVRALYQSVHVEGLGSKQDSARYGHGKFDSPLVSMEGVARLIAGEIIGANRVREQ